MCYKEKPRENGGFSPGVTKRCTCYALILELQYHSVSYNDSRYLQAAAISLGAHGFYHVGLAMTTVVVLAYHAWNIWRLIAFRLTWILMILNRSMIAAALPSLEWLGCLIYMVPYVGDMINLSWTHKLAGLKLVLINQCLLLHEALLSSYEMQNRSI